MEEKKLTRIPLVMANEQGKAQYENLQSKVAWNVVYKDTIGL